MNYVALATELLYNEKNGGKGRTILMDIMAMAERHGKVLRKSKLFKGLSDDALISALRFFRAEEASYKKGEFLHHFGEPMERFGIALSGTIHVCTDDLDGTQMIMADISSGDIFAESLCFLRVSESPVYIYAAEDVQMLWLRDDSVRNGVGGEFANRFISVIAEKALSMNSRIQILSKKTLRLKLITFFTEFSRRVGSSTFIIPFDRNDMATYLGADRSALSRELSKMKEEGLIDYYKNTFKLLK